MKLRESEHSPMTRATVVTGYGPGGWDAYARNMVASVRENWPSDTKLVVYTEEALPLTAPASVEFRPPPRASVLFQQRHGADPEARGVQPRQGFSWKAKDRKAGYSFRYDAVKFSKMAFYAADAAQKCDTHTMIWLDGDTLTYRRVPDGLIDELFGNAAVVYLGREPYHPDTGFVGFRGGAGLAVARTWGGLYESGEIFKLREWHSAYAFRHAVSRHVRDHGLVARDLTPGGKKHVFFQCKVGEYIDHLKGERRKAMGRSEERPS